jgi:glycosyltransferase involved in cell wall biosynthesis
MSLFSESRGAKAAVALGSEPAAPLASVVMLAYNHGRYLRESVESIVQQKTSFPFECIIGEDCSPDDTRKIALELQQAYPEIVRVITSDKNVGALENLRRVEQACRGRYVAYCDGDDYWHARHKLQAQVDFLEANPEYVLVHGGWRWFFVETGRLSSNVMYQPSDLKDEEAYFDLLMNRRVVMTLTACARRTALDSVLRECPECYDSHFLMGDTQRWLELSRRGKVKYLPEMLATYRILPESASQAKDPRRVLRFALSAREILYHYMRKYECPVAVEKVAKARTTLAVLGAAYRAMDHGVTRILYEEYRDLGVSRSAKAFLYYHGSRSRSLKYIIGPALCVGNLWQKAMRRLPFLRSLAS